MIIEGLYQVMIAIYNLHVLKGITASDADGTGYSLTVNYAKKDMAKVNKEKAALCSHLCHN
ncbi:MAG: hypothetical protein QW839_01570 [Conexivisphaerales archaeon]